MFHKFAKKWKELSFILLSKQSEFLHKRLNEKIGFNSKKSIDGCTLELKEEEKNLQKKIDEEVAAILKICKNNSKAIVDYLGKNNVKVYQIKNGKKKLEKINEKYGFITDRKGLTALYLNHIIKENLSLNFKTSVILDDGELDVYELIYSLHKWCANKYKLKGFDKKSQNLLRQFNDPKNDDKIINKLSYKDMNLIQNAIARDVQAINFVSKYAKEHDGAKKALEKLQNDDGASI